MVDSKEKGSKRPNICEQHDRAGQNVYEQLCRSGMYNEMFQYLPNSLRSGTIIKTRGVAHTVRIKNIFS